MTDNALINHEDNLSLWHKIWAFIQRHAELLAAGLCALFIALAYLLPAYAVPLFLTAFIIGGFAKAREGIIDFVYNRHFNVELLMIFAAIGACIIGHWAEGAILIFIFSLSGALETYTLNKSERDLSKLIQLQPNEATRIRNGKHEVVAVDVLDIGDQVLVKPGERFPIDGKIMQGSSSINEAPITGESLAVDKQPADDVFAGTLNVTGSIVMKVTRRNQDTLFQKIVRLVQEAKQEKAPAQQFVEKFERKYVKIVLIVVLIMFFAPHYIVGWSWEETWYRALVLLVVASPCALVASISPAVLSVLSYGARNGVLIKGGSHIERLATIQFAALDKTGTITVGAPKVTDVYVRDGLAEATVLAAAAGLEQHSSHSLAKAIIQYAQQQACTPLAFEDGVTDEPGRGIHGISVNGERWWAGNARFVGEQEADQFVQHVLHDEDIEGKTLIFVRSEQGIAGALALRDTVRPEAREAIQQLENMGIGVMMITGDQHSAARAVAAETGIKQYQAGALPDEKMEWIDQLRHKHGAVMMIGDGINDAPSLARADIGVAMGGGTHIALDTADLVLVQNNLQKVADMIRSAQKMSRIIKHNVYFSLAVIAVLILANFVQILTLPHGVIAHEGSTILVILNGLRMLRG